MFGKVCNSYNCIQECLPIFAQSYLTLCNPMDYTVYGILQARILEWLAFPFSRELPNPGIEPRSLALQVDSLPAEPQGKPENTGVGNLSLLQEIFPTQESNCGFLYCRQADSLPTELWKKHLQRLAEVPGARTLHTPTLGFDTQPLP